MRKPLKTVSLLTVFVLTIFSLSACIRSSDYVQNVDGKTIINVYDDGDTNVQQLWLKGLVPAFEKQYPQYLVKMNFDLHGTNSQSMLAKIIAAIKLKRTTPYDLLDSGINLQLASANLLQPETTTQIPNLKYVPSKFLNLGGEGTIPYRGSSVILAYNTKYVTNPPKTLDELLDWIKTNPGKFTYNSPNTGGSGSSFVNTVLDKYLTQQETNTLDTTYDPKLETQWDKGFNVLKSLNRYVYQNGVYPNGNNQVLNLLASGQIWVAPVWSDQFASGKTSGLIPKSIDSTQISDPSFTGSPSFMGIPVSAGQKVGAQIFANWILSPEGQNIVVNQINGYPVLPLNMLELKAQKQFANANIANLRPGYNSKVSSDMSNLWSQKVPG